MTAESVHEMYSKIESELEKLRKNNPIIAMYCLLQESDYSDPLVKKGDEWVNKEESEYVHLGEDILKHPDVLFYKKMQGMHNWFAAKGAEKN